MKKICFLLMAIFLLSACGITEDMEPPATLTEGPYPPEDEVTEDDFVYRVYTEKDVYKEFEETSIFAELTYTGKRDSVTISHASSLFIFPLEEEMRDIEIEYAVDDVEILTELKRDEPVKSKYVFAGGYSDQDDEDTIRFVKTLMNKGFLAGDYVIKSYARFTVADSEDEHDEDQYDMNANIGFRVR